MINQGSKLQFLLVFMVDKMKILFAVISLLGLQNVFSAENIYEDAIAHFIEDVIEHQELSFSEGNRDVALIHYNNALKLSVIEDKYSLADTINTRIRQLQNNMDYSLPTKSDRIHEKSLRH